MAHSVDHDSMDTDSSGGEEDGKLPITDHRQLRCYSRIIKDIFAGLSEAMDSKAVEDFQTECLRLSMDKNLYTELISQEKWEEVLQLILKSANDDVHLVLEILHNFIPKVIPDLRPEVAGSIKFLYDLVTRNNQDFNLENSMIYGRQDELQMLSELMNFEKERNVKLINICGMTGIGKSHLLKHFGSRYLDERLVPIYVDAK
ncbi:hypothetical protein EB796_013736 [Bugula neritina]|nr:hypothetical protein EB796_013736 [Bugula neritina]